MIKLKIPESHYKGFSELLKLNQIKLTKLYDFIKNVKTKLISKENIEKISKILKLDNNESKLILNVISSLYLLRLSAITKKFELSEEIFSALTETKRNELFPTDRFKKFVTSILKLDEGAYLQGVVQNIFSERERLTLDSKIFTDIRPVFNNINELKGFLIFQNLKIEYFESGQRKEIFLGIDKDDLLRLKKNIEEAENSEKKLKESLKKTNKNFLENWLE